MRLLIQVDNVTKVSMINMGVHTEQPFQYCLGYRKEVLWKCNTYKYTTKDNIVIISILVHKETTTRWIIGASLSEPHTSELFRAIVHAQKITTKSVNLHVLREFDSVDYGLCYRSCSVSKRHRLQGSYIWFVLSFINFMLR